MTCSLKEEKRRKVETDGFLCPPPALQQIDNGLMVGNSQVIFEKAESSSLTLVGEFLNWAQFHPGAVLINGWEVICTALQTKSTVVVHFPGA